MVKYCPNCGAPNEDNAMFCIKCGSPLSQSTAQAPQGYQQFQQPPVQQTQPQSYPSSQVQFYQPQQQFIANQYPRSAYILSLISGIFVILGGIIVMAISTLMTMFALGIGGIYGVLGIIWGIIIIVGTMRLKSNPNNHVSWGVIILVFSIISWFGAAGGLFIGFILGLVGGILAITWHPPMYHV